MSASRERTFDRDVADETALCEALDTMARELCASLRAKGRSGRTVSIKVRLEDFSTFTRARTLPEATCDGDVVSAVALALLRAHAPQRAVRLVGVRVAGLQERGGSVSVAAPGRTSGVDAEDSDQLALPV